MFLAIVFIVLGLFLLLNALGIISGNFWGLFWAVVFLVIGFRMLQKKRICPMCMIHSKMHNHCNCEHNHDHGAGEAKHDEQN